MSGRLGWIKKCNNESREKVGEFTLKPVKEEMNIYGSYITVKRGGQKNRMSDKKIDKAARDKPFLE